MSSVSCSVREDCDAFAPVSWGLYLFSCALLDYKLVKLFLYKRASNNLHSASEEGTNKLSGWTSCSSCVRT